MIHIPKKELVVPSLFRPCGEFIVEHYRKGKLIGKYKLQNGVTNIGLDTVLDIMFGATAKISTWYLGLIDNAGFTALAAGDTMASHPGWTEYTAYSEANRPTWGTGSASGQSITNATPEEFNITGTTDVLNGMFAVSDNTKGGSSGVLWATASFTSTIPVDNGDLLKLTYTVSGS